MEGSGHFIGEPPTGSISQAPENVTDGVTIRFYKGTEELKSYGIITVK